MCHHLSFTSDNSGDDQNPDDSDQDPDSTQVPTEEEEDFPTVPLDDKHWLAEIVPERTLCIHENGLPKEDMPTPMPLCEQ